MKRRAFVEFDSLELLLDTICNTFGGILFVAVLVIILVHRASDIQEQVEPVRDPLASSTLSQELNRRTVVLKELQLAFSEYQKNISALETRDSSVLAHRVVAMRSEVAKLTANRVQYLQRIAELSERKSEHDKKRQSQTTELDLARKSAQSLQEQLAREQRARSRVASLPILRETQKREFPLILRFGRIYIPFTAERTLTTRKSNLDDFVVLSQEGPVIRVTPKPYRGLPVGDDDLFINSLSKSLSALDSQSVYLAIGVWEDSFEQFQSLRQAIVKLGFEYRLIPVADGEYIQESPVKQTLVQ